MAISRRRFLFGSVVTAAGAGALGYGRFVESTNLQQDTVRVELPLELLRTPLRILHLSDLHYSGVVPLHFIEEAFQLGLQQKPDLICLTGDYTTANDSAPITDLLPLLESLSLTAPTIATFGNHDGGPWTTGMGGASDTTLTEQVLTEAGVHVLQNLSKSITIGSQEIELIGLEDLWSDKLDAEAAFQTVTEPRKPRIVLSHNPDSKAWLAEKEWDLMLSGHTHGGQVVIPFLGAPVVPIQDKAFTAGLNRWNDKWIYTTRGVGNLHGFRFNCPPEVSIIDLVPN